MRKQKLLLAALMCALVFAGCKKKEPVDLSSLHTTAAVETETMPEVIETTAAAPSESSAEDNKNTESKFSLNTTIKKHNDKNISVEFPEISGMKDAKKQTLVNDMLKHNAQSIAAVLPATEEGQSLSLKATVESANLRRITVTYQGEYKESPSKNTPVFFTNTINLETGENLCLSDYTDAYTAAGYIVSGDYKLEATSGADEQAIRSFINSAEKNTDYYYKKLHAADFQPADGAGNTVYTAETWPDVFSYEKQGTIYISLSVPPELGSYVIIRYNPDNK